MSAFTLFLFPDGREAQELELHQHSLESSIVDTARRTENYVFNNFNYSGQLQSDTPQTVSDFQLYINGSIVETEYQQQTGRFSIKDATYGAKPFVECYGYIQLTVSFRVDEDTYSLDTKYISVMVRKGLQNESVSRMTDYVYRNNEELLFSGVQLPKNASGLKDSERKTIESRIFLLHEIAQIFESNYAFFKVNSRFTTVQSERIDRFEKLQYVSTKTMQFISQHPDELQRINSSVGVRVGKYNYQPGRTLITNNIQTYDIYENKEILGFLDSLLTEIGGMQKELEGLISSIPEKPIESGDYVASPFFIFASTIATLNTILVDLSKLKSKYSALLSAYTSIYQIKGNRVIKPSRPTAVFMSIPQYRQAYDCMTAWFKMGVVRLDEERYMLSFLKISSLYEVYVLLKLVNYLKENGYSLTSTNRIQYQFSSRTFYENTKCNNLYIFESEGGNSKVSVYYQPVIYNADRSERTGIGLYRNTSIAFPNLSGEERTGGYYTPDFLIKIENATSNYIKYVLADAKFSTVENVKTYQVAPLAYKYLFSISPVSLTDIVAGLFIVNGQSEKDIDTITDIYDKSLTPNKITPNAEILTLTENSVDNAENHAKLLKQVVGKYLF